MNPVPDAVARVFCHLRAIVGYIRNSDDDLRGVYGAHPKGSTVAQQSAMHGAVGISIANNSLI